MAPKLTELDALRLRAQQHPCTQSREALAQGLVQAVLAAREKAHVPAVNALLQELRELAAAHGEQKAYEALGGALFQALCTHLYVGEAEIAQHCLQELRSLFQQQGGTALLLELAEGVFEMVSDRSLADDHMGVEELLDELQQLSQQYDNPKVHKALASGLFNAQYDHFARENTQPALACLAGLRALAKGRGTPEVRVLLARGLYNAIYSYSLAGETAIAIAYVKELEALATAHNDPEVRAALGSALFSINNDALQNRNPLGTRYCLQELRQLVQQHDEAALRASLASTLLATYNAYSIAGEALGMEQVMQELRGLAHKHAEPGVLEEFAKMLCNGLCATLEAEKHSVQEPVHGMTQALPRKMLTGHAGPQAAEALLHELAALCRKHNDAQVAAQYAHGLTAAMAGPCMQGYMAVAKGLLQELRVLAGRFPTPVVQGALAEGLVSMQACHLAQQGHGRVVAGMTMLPQASQTFSAGSAIHIVSPAEQDHGFFLLLEELRSLAQVCPTPALQEELVKGLVNGLAYVPKAGGTAPASGMLLKELRALATPACPQALQVLLGQGLYNAARTAHMEEAVREALALLQEAQAIVEPLRQFDAELMDVYGNIVAEIAAIEQVYGTLPQSTVLQ
ncbi:hypothetical protein [Desulfovibrio cuneatus]|uniref:hypothetical protein n=1 Tax=Desulfovibrio cuneatus TaxID=159728 RepID=UPI000414D246|nr:hypothetical protein [Desulfovibrio cuneatus]